MSEDLEEQNSVSEENAPESIALPAEDETEVWGLLMQKAGEKCDEDVLSEISTIGQEKIEELQNCRSEILVLRERLGGALEEFHKLEKTYSSDMRKMRKQGSQQLALVEEQVAQLGEERDYFEAMVENLENVADEEKEKHSERVGQLERDIAELNNKCAQKDARIEQIGYAMDDLTTKIDVLDSEMAKKEQETLYFEQETSEFKSELVQCQLEVKSEADQIRELERQVRNYRCILGKLAPNIEDRVTRQQEIRREVESTKIGVFLDDDEWTRVEAIEGEYNAFKAKHNILLQRVKELEDLLGQSKEPDDTRISGSNQRKSSVEIQRTSQKGSVDKADRHADH